MRQAEILKKQAQLLKDIDTLSNKTAKEKDKLILIN